MSIVGIFTSACVDFKRETLAMDFLVKGWFSEISDELWPGQCFSLKVKEVLHEEQSDFQSIKILQT